MSKDIDTIRLSENERVYVMGRLRKDQGKAAIERRITFKDVINVFKDYKVVLAGFMYLGILVPAYR